MTKVVVTGGASFIGSHLVDALRENHDILILDNLSSGSLDNLKHAKYNLIHIDLRTVPPIELAAYLHNAEIVFHLAADHGGRGYVETQQVACSNNFAIDNNVFQACVLARVPKIIYASSGCMYPMSLQQNVDRITYLDETHGLPPYDPDGLYGLAKVAGEQTLMYMFNEYGIESTACRFFTVYGPRAKENHAIMSFIARVFIKQDPIIVWGDGLQIRNWTHVSTIVDGMLLATELSGFNTLNLGTMQRITVHEAVLRTIELANELYYNNSYHPRIEYDKTKPVGPLARIANNQLYKDLGGTEPITFMSGLRQTLQWYFENKDREYIRQNLNRLLIERT
jgi:nucleoside-diphosphate-sugar epimerase